MKALAGIVLAVVMLSSCTAFRVVTHTTTADPVQAPTGRYHLDPHHWSVIFDVDHFKYTRFVMRFDRVSGTLDFVPGMPEQSRVSAVIEAGRVNTNDAELDALVKGPEMLDAAAYPQIRFESTAITRTGPTEGQMTGALTLHGKTVPVVLQVRFNGGAPSPLTRDYTLGFAATGTFDRSNFGLGTWFPAVGNDVHVSIQAEFVKDAEPGN